jgi:hypothetical protein
MRELTMTGLRSFCLSYLVIGFEESLGWLDPAWHRD